MEETFRSIQSNARLMICLILKIPPPNSFKNIIRYSFVHRLFHQTYSKTKNTWSRSGTCTTYTYMDYGYLRVGNNISSFNLDFEVWSHRFNFPQTESKFAVYLEHLQKRFERSSRQKWSFETHDKSVFRMSQQFFIKVNLFGSFDSESSFNPFHLQWKSS